MQPGEEIIHVLPQEFKVDSQPEIIHPIGMYGSRLEANFHVVVGQIASIKNIARCVKSAGLNLTGITLEPIASSNATLSTEEKEAGVALIDIGGGTTDVAIFKDGIIRHTSVIPFGGNIVTEDIKTGCSIIERQAEVLKVKYGSAWPGANKDNEVVTIPGLRGREPKEISLKKLSEIIHARILEILDQTFTELENYGCHEQKKKLIAGVVMTGGGSKLKHIRQLAEYVTGMDVRIGFSNEHFAHSQDDELANPEYATAVGLLMKGLEQIEEREEMEEEMMTPNETQPSAQRKGIDGVDFVICNTDAQALNNSPVPNRIQLGVSVTEGLGAGANPDIGEQAALESLEEVKNLLTNNTKMVFITAGMGGGTGTGAAPIIAGIAKEMGILTVGIVTSPFYFEGKMRLEQAEAGIKRLRNNVDSLIVVNNDKLRELYGNLGYKAGFAKADEVLSTASKGIAEVITKHYSTNIDLRDARTVLANSGTAIMGSAISSGENKAMDAISKALDSPLLNDNKITGAKNVLLLIVSGETEITVDEIGIVNDYIQKEAGNRANVIMGIGEDLTLGESISVTVVATGFPVEDQKYTGLEEEKIVHRLDDDQALIKEFEVELDDRPVREVEPNEDGKIVHRLEEADFLEPEMPKKKNLNKQGHLFAEEEEMKLSTRPEMQVQPSMTKEIDLEEPISELEEERFDDETSFIFNINQ
ncbi:unnamed protein product, partial [Cyprideis torosa]